MLSPEEQGTGNARHWARWTGHQALTTGSAGLRAHHPPRTGPLIARRSEGCHLFVMPPWRDAAVAGQLHTTTPVLSTG